MHLKKLLKKPVLFAVIGAVTILSMNSYALLKTFKIAQVSAYVGESGSSASQGSTTDNSSSSGQDTSSAVVSDTAYSDENIQISLETLTTNDTTVYVADIQVSSPEYLKTALAQNAFGRNVTATTSTIASENNAILAINGDYYGANDSGYVIRNGELLRNMVRSGDTTEDLAIYEDGSFQIIDEAEVSAEKLVSDGVVNLLAFGPALIEDGEISVSPSDEVGKAMSENPRTAIGIIDETHYIIVVSDGRTSESAGLSLYQLAQVMESYQVQTAYNLDGGGSSTLYFNGEVINKPTTNGNSIQERKVSDIVYIGY